jgi:hypothetical protein
MSGRTTRSSRTTQGPGEVAAPIAGYPGHWTREEFEVLEYDNLDAMIEDGWEID